MSKENILANVRAAQPEPIDLPPALEGATVYGNPVAKFMETAITIGSQVFEVPDLVAVCNRLQEGYLAELKQRWQIEKPLRIVSTLKAFEGLAEVDFTAETDPHSFENVDVAIMQANLGVAENSALWVPEQSIRVLPFICQHLILVIKKASLVSNMHQAYDLLSLGSNDPYGAFIAGPSKTADIEQSLVLGAHGPRSLGIYLLE